MSGQWKCWRNFGSNFSHKNSDFSLDGAPFRFHLFFFCSNLIQFFLSFFVVFDGDGVNLLVRNLRNQIKQIFWFYYHEFFSLFRISPDRIKLMLKVFRTYTWIRVFLAHTEWSSRISQIFTKKFFWIFLLRIDFLKFTVLFIKIYFRNFFNTFPAISW